MIVIPTSSYPLAWPMGVARTPNQERKDSPFFTATKGPNGVVAQRHNKTTKDATDKLVAELRRLVPWTFVISTNVPARDDGIPYADSSQQPKGDSGAAVYWSVKRRGVLVPYCMPCDRWSRLADNLYAIGMSIEAMRGMDRWGCVTVEQAFAGFTALPPGDTSSMVRPWREVLGGTWPDHELEPDEVLALARARHRKLIATAHPDAGGGHEVAAALNGALDQAERELGNKA